MSSCPKCLAGHKPSHPCIQCNKLVHLHKLCSKSLELKNLKDLKILISEVLFSNLLKS